ncbi:MAG: Pr6Pr family membrane protein [Clostridiales bacterium]|nr:Pr6Pr family membrane protein [Clostridiales bacterium]
MISRKDRIISLILKAVVFAAAVAGTVLSAASGRHVFMGGGTVFMYFTIQSNLFAAAVSAAGAVLLLRKKPVPGAWYVVRLVMAVAITLTGAVFCFVLAPTIWKSAWSLPNILTHVIVPAASVADFFVSCRPGELKKRDILFVLIPPFSYVIYAGIGFAAGWEFSPGNNYPYFFLNWGSPAGAFGFSDRLPFMGCFWWILLLTGLICGTGLLYLALLEKLKNRGKGGKGREEKEELYLELSDGEWPFEYTDHDRQIVRAIVFDSEGFLWFVRAERNDAFGRATLIETSGGGVEPGEELEGAVRRELKEELGAEVEVVSKIGVVSDYYNLIHRHNINNYYLCRALSFGERHLMPDEIEDFHLSTLKLSFSEAVAEYESRACTPIGRLIANRELPVLMRAGKMLGIIPAEE